MINWLLLFVPLSIVLEYFAPAHFLLVSSAPRSPSCRWQAGWDAPPCNWPHIWARAWVGYSMPHSVMLPS